MGITTSTAVDSALREAMLGSLPYKAIRNPWRVRLSTGTEATKPSELSAMSSQRSKVIRARTDSGIGSPALWSTPPRSRSAMPWPTLALT